MEKRENRLSKEIIKAAMQVHSELGPGLLESVYETCLCSELIEMGLAVERQLPVPVVYRGKKLDCGFRLDVLVEKLVIVEIKAVNSFSPVHTAQAITYLRLSGIKLCLILNFNVAHMREGIKRVVMNI